MEYKEKVNVYVPESIGEQLKKDAVLFEIYKSDKHTINRNRFFSLLLVGYYNKYAEEYNQKYDSILEILQGIYDDPGDNQDAAECLLNSISLQEIPKRKGKHPIKLSLKPTRDTNGIIQNIRDELLADDYISQYLCRMFISYSKKPLYERERIIFRDNYLALLDACQKSRTITFRTIWDDSVVHEVLPYQISVGQDEMFNYLLCQEKNRLSGKLEAKTYRLNRITSMNVSATIIKLSDDIKTYLDLMIKYGAQYPINGNDEICVKLNDYGVISYNRIYYGRPQYDHKESKEDGTYYYFRCSIDQVYLYFKRFDYGAAEIIAPKVLKDRMISFHKEALAAYNE